MDGDVCTGSSHEEVKEAEGRGWERCLDERTGELQNGPPIASMVQQQQQQSTTLAEAHRGLL